MIRVAAACLTGLLFTAPTVSGQSPRRPTAQDVDRAFEAAAEADVAASRAHMDADTRRRATRAAETDVSIGTAGPFRVIAATDRLAEAEDAVTRA